MGEDATFPILETYNFTPAVITGTYPLAEKAILLSPNDNVAVARQDIARGVTILCGETEICLRDSIPTGHKFALREIPHGSYIYKYSQIIGKAMYPIQPGEWVHTHNVELAHDLDHHEYAIDRPQAPELPQICRGLSWVIAGRTAAWARETTSPSLPPAIAPVSSVKALPN